ncbi:MAG: LamG-like jellyroll fold domain-containing protein [Chitinophagales bacterium]
MRKILFLLLFITTSINAQNKAEFFKAIPYLDGSEPAWASLMYSENPNVYEVIEQHDAFYKTHEFEKNIHTQNYKFWLIHIGEYLNDKGFIESKNPEREKWINQLKQKRQSEALQKKTDIWAAIGPFETYADDDNLGVIPVSWQVNVYCIDQSVSNPNVLYAGTEGQGAWKTTDKGLNWTLITKNEDIRGIQDIKVAATDENLVYLADNSNIYQSTDGGTTWASVYSINGTYQIVIHPTNPDIVFAVGQNGLHKTTNGGDTWTEQYGDKFWDINFHPIQPNILYTLRHNPTLQYAEFWKSTDTGTTWTQVNNGWYNPINANFNEHIDYGALIAVTPLEPNKVYVGMMGNHKVQDNVWIGVYRSENEGESWTNPIQDGGPYNTITNQNLATSGRTSGFSQTFYDFGFDASHTVAGKLYLGVLSLSVSSNGGNSWTRIGGYDTPSESDAGWIHPDIQDIHVLGGDVWVATDGGINYSNDEFATHESRKNGLVGSHFWGLGQGWNKDVLVGGRYHNGNTALYEVYGTGNSSRLGGGEAATGYVDLLNPLTTYFSDISTSLLDPTIAGKQSYTGQLGKYPHESYFHAENSEIVRDPRYAHHLYLGASTGLQDGGFWKSTDNGNSFDLLHSFGSGKVTGIEVSRQNPDLLYCVYNKTNIYKSLDGGRTWDVTANLPSSGSKLISINPANDQELWIFANTNNDTNKVFRTTDGGANWSNMTTSTLDGHRINDGFFQGGSQHSRVYVVSSYGLFYWDDIAAEWIDYHEGLPFVMGDVKHIFKPFYRDSKIRLSSVMGIWEAPFEETSLPLAQPMTSQDIVYCSRDTVQFDCYSILNHADAIWQWTFSPEPLWVSSTTERNPKVLLQNETSYDVTLTVTDGNGNSDSKTIPNMVTVLSQCEAEKTTGLALQTSNDGDWVQTPNIPFTSNTVTMTAWVKPNGIQPEYSGIVMNDGTTAGFNFRESNNTLGYHWPGGAWWWDSGLEVPADEWSHVALVATPNSLTVYVNGIGSTHTTDLEVVDFGSLKIGSYKAWGGRNYKGLIDEVCIWNRSLSQDEIRELRHLTQIPINDPDIIAYYQFNDNAKSILDRADSYHAALVGQAELTPSNAPFGGGVSHRTMINVAGTYDFGETGTQLTFASNATYPNGEIVVSRLDVLPNTIPNDNSIQSQNLQQHWIINNYGSNPSFAALQNLQFNPSAFNHALQSVQNAPQISLYQRSENSEANDWSESCNAATFSAMGNGSFGFNADCNLTESGQFFLTTKTIPVKLKAILEGAYNLQTASMTNQLQNNNLLPLQQPYNSEPWNYTGSEQVATKSLFPSNVVDWVLIEARDAANENAFLTSKAALLLQNGTIRDVDASVAEGVYFSGLDAETDYRFVLRHRNHLAVMTSTAFSIPNATTYDWSMGANQALGQHQLKQMSSGVFALHAGDFDGDSVITVADYNLYISQLATLNIYILGDLNLDGQVTVADFNLYLPNSSLIGVVKE